MVFGRRFAAIAWVAWAWIAGSEAAELDRPLISLAGSNTVGQRLAPALARAWAQTRGWEVAATRTTQLDEYQIRLTRNGESAVIDIKAHGTGTGLQSLQRGEADIWMASRPVNEAELIEAAGLGRLDLPEQEHVIALDGLAIIVHRDNPIAEISVVDLRRVFSGDVRDWAQLGGRPGRIVVHARDDRSGTYDTFRSLVLANRALVASAARHESSDELAGAVMADPQAIGFVGLAAVGANRTLRVSDGGAQPLAPTRMDVATEDYPLARRLLLYVPQSVSATASDFIEFAQSDAGQRIVEQVGFVGQSIHAETPPQRADLPDAYRELTAQSLRISANFRFDSGVTYLDGKALRDIERLATFLNSPVMRQHEVTVIGFSDAKETSPIDAILISNERADYIADQLTRAGVAVRRVRGVGGGLPIASNETEPGRRRNRRIEVWVKPRR